MWNFGTMHHQGPKNSDTQRKRSPASSAPATPWIPNSALPPVHQDSIKSIVRKTLLATPEFPRLYADMVLSTRPNSVEAKILRPKYQQILHRINLMETEKAALISRSPAYVAALPLSAESNSASALTPHNVTKPPAKPPQPSPASNRANSGAHSAQRKPPNACRASTLNGEKSEDQR